MPKMSANIFITKDYENEPPSGPKKQTQTNPISNVRYLSSVLEFTQEFIPGSHPPDSQQGSACFSVSLPGVVRFLMQPKLLNFHRKNSLTGLCNSVKYRFLCNESECFYEELYGKKRTGRAEMDAR